MNQLDNYVKQLSSFGPLPITDRFNEFDVNKMRIQFSLQKLLAMISIFEKNKCPGE